MFKYFQESILTLVKTKSGVTVQESDSHCVKGGLLRGGKEEMNAYSDIKNHE